MRNYHRKEAIPYNTNKGVYLTFHGGSLMVVCRFVSLREGLLGPIGTQKTGKNKIIQYCEKDRVNLQTTQKDRNNSSFHEFSLKPETTNNGIGIG